jgi:protein-S-isoprenylcysteine O-methyltransferase
LIILLLAGYQSPLWRLPFFLLILSWFHFLEYYITARFNPAAATTSAFLLSQNGSAYNVAHTLAFLECALHCYLWPHGGLFSLRAAPYLWLVLGLGLVVVGQTTRTMAMVHAGSNFNHLVQSRKKQGHVLVTGGIYAWLRHPSYFGFFWWGLGTQLALGNLICLAGYAVVLWRFFKRRIEGKSSTSG